MTTNRLNPLLFLLFLLVATPLLAQWLPMSSPVQGIKTWKIKVVGTRLYALTNQGPYVSDNDGLTWISFTNGLPAWNNTIEYRSMDATSTRIMIGTSAGKVYTTSPTTSFTEVSAGLPSGKVTAIQMVGTVAIAGFQSGGLYRSADNGNSWTQGTINSSTLEVNNLHFGAGLLFATTDNGIYSSADTGKTWTPRSNGLTNLNTSGFTTVANQLITSTPDGIRTSTIADPNWVAATPTGVSGTVDVIVKFANKYILGVRGDKTCLSGDDLNGTFTQSKDLPKDGAVLTLATKGTRTFAGLDGGGVYMSENLGASWVPQCVGLPNQTEINRLGINNISIFATTRPLAYGRSSGGFFIFSKVGTAKNNWQLLGTPSRNDQTGTDVLSFDMNMPYLLTGSNGQGILRSNDYAYGWAASNTGIAAGNSNRTIHHIRMLSQPRVIAATGNGVILSTDTGYTWTNTLSGTLSDQVWDFEKIDETMFAASEKGVFRSLDSGETWTQLPGLINQPVHALTKLGTTLYAALNTGVQKSTTNGNSWQDITANLAVSGIKDVLASNGLLLVAHDAGIHMSQNDGQNWATFSENLPNRKVQTLIDSGTVLYAGLSGGGPNEPGGIWRRDITLLTGNQTAHHTPLSALEISSIYPNPTKNQFAITLRSTKAGVLEMEICDLVGRVIQKENGGNLPIGKTTYPVQHQLVPGIYLLCIRQSGEQTVQRFVVE